MPHIACDHHTHPFCRQRTLDGMRLFAESALARGLRKMVFTEHAPLNPAWPGDSHFLSAAQLPLYLDYAHLLQAEYAGRLEIGIGLEIDYHPDNLSHLERLLKRHPVDYVGMSLHLHLGYWQAELARYDQQQQLRAALRHTRDAIACGLGHGLNHFDFFRKVMPWYDPTPYEDDIRAIFTALLEKNMSLELNLSGYKNFSDSMPCSQVWQWSWEYPLRRTFGSDAHEPQEVGNFFERATLPAEP